jgi:hypothetical protein
LLDHKEQVWHVWCNKRQQHALEIPYSLTQSKRRFVMGTDPLLLT